MKWCFIFIALVSSSSLTIAQDLQPDDTNALLNVSVIDFMKKPLQGEQVSFTSAKTHKVFSGTTDSTGKFHLLIPKGVNYTIKYAQFTSDVDYNKTLTVPEGKDQLLTFNYTVVVELPEKYTLKNVFFDFDKATIRPDSYTELNKLTSFIKGKKTMVIEIAGYTDNVGTDAANLKLSQERADAIRNYLVQHGLDPSKITAKGYGATDFVAANDTPEGRQQNRRTEVHIIKK